MNNYHSRDNGATTALAVGTVAALAATTAVAASNHRDHDDYEERRQVVDTQPQVVAQQVASTPAPAPVKVEPPKPLTEAERVAAAIKHMWVAPCKEWMCLNK